MPKKSKQPQTNPLRVPHVSNKKSLAHLLLRSGQTCEPLYQAFFTTAVQNVDRVCNLADAHKVAYKRLDTLPLGHPEYAVLNARVTKLGQELLNVKESLRRDLAELAVYRAEDKARHGEGLPPKEYRMRGLLVAEAGVEPYSTIATSPEEAVIHFMGACAQNARGESMYYVETVGDPKAPMILVRGRWHDGEPAAYISGEA
jgi:hypothetical protein